MKTHCFQVKSESCSVVSDSLWPHGLYSPCNSPGRNTGVGSLSLLQGIFRTQGSNPDLLHCRWILYQLSHNRSPRNKWTTQFKPVFFKGQPWNSREIVEKYYCRVDPWITQHRFELCGPFILFFFRYVSSTVSWIQII